MFRTLVILSSLLVLAACGDTESKPFEFEETNITTANNTTANNTTANNTSANNTSANNTSANNTSANNTTANNNGCVIAEPPEHRAVSTACDDMRLPGNGGDGPGDCAADSDCIDNMGSTNGRCTASRGGSLCTYDECGADSDCGGDSVCDCGGGSLSDNNVCKPGNCITDADCGEAGYCAPSLSDCGDYLGVTGYFCRTCDDECVSDDDCPDNVDGGGRGYCAFDGSKWACSNSFCVG